MGGYFSCYSNCDFDQCLDCSRCKKGHAFKVQVGNPYSRNLLFTNPRCDRCRTYLPQEQWSAGYARCAQCEFDVCLTCIPIGRN